jgi:hypothetical protein
MVNAKTPVEMFNDLVQMGYVTPATIEPTIWMEPTAYVAVPSNLAFATPPVQAGGGVAPGGKTSAKLGSRPKGNRKRTGRSKRRISGR